MPKKVGVVLPCKLYTCSSSTNNIINTLLSNFASLVHDIVCIKGIAHAEVVYSRDGNTINTHQSNDEAVQ